MGKRQVKILDKAAEEVANVAFFIEGKGLPATAKRFVDEAFLFFTKLSDERIKHKPCKAVIWQMLDYRCTNFKKYVVAYIDTEEEIIICDFVLQKMIR